MAAPFPNPFTSVDVHQQQTKISQVPKYQKNELKEVGQRTLFVIIGPF
jgi:hypothetical protein